MKRSELKKIVQEVIKEDKHNLLDRSQFLKRLKFFDANLYALQRAIGEMPDSMARNSSLYIEGKMDEAIGKQFKEILDCVDNLKVTAKSLGMKVK